MALAHIVLFRPRPDLDSADRDGFLAALERAHREIPAIRRFRIGRRVKPGAAYEAGMAVDYEFVAVIEFDDLKGLRGYLAHPAHADLGARFGATMESALVYDFELTDDAASL